ncbi:DUF4169 family protein [Cognatiyoonia sp. IB215182]|uniref:DUF4169 family protein n=1 Tax=Cognatiyoonia sp. IB215182 TaxID=3097353 RepID=UPI002A10CCAB|nr:DUF4169 family protein [Cognatiyoonia sp. IB215182]MDX8353517.1 DUF4169 family protein [Cognatiyoonia sp. IB215182]
MKPINLNQARKARAKTQAKAQADQNAIRFGRTKAEKERDKAEVERANKRLDQLRRDE